ncbi:MAG: hypothetical protein ABH851_03820 [Methanobacteriota archaeon]
MKKLFAPIVLLALIGSACAEIKIDSLALDPQMIEAGDEVDVYVKFHQATLKRDVFTKDGVLAAEQEDKNVFYKTKLIPTSDLASKYITLIEGEKNVGHLFIGESWNSPFKVKVSEGAPAANYKMQFQIIKTDPEGVEKGIDRLYDFTIPVKGIVVFDVSSTDDLRIGSEGTIKLSVRNVGGGTARHVTVKLGELDSLTVLDAAERHLDSFEGKEEKTVTYKISVDSTATVTAKKIPLFIGYLTDNGLPVLINKTIGVQITGEPSIEVTLDEAEELVGGMEGTVSIRVINNGFIDAKFLEMSLSETQDYTVESAESTYLGNLASDDFESEEFIIKPSKNTEGEIPLTVTVVYKMANSDKLLSKSFTTKVKVLSESEYRENEQSNGSSSQVQAALLAIPAIIVVYLVLWFVVKIVGAITNLLNKKIFKRGV